MSYKKILKTGRNCWRIKRADRVAFLVDGDNYFSALHNVLPRAEKNISILSWDIYSGLKPGALKGDNRSIRQIFEDILNEKDDLDIHILSWDFSVLFAMSREWLPNYKLGWLTHPRMHFQLDKQYSLGASHHQKVVVIDNQLAFSGGLDLTRGRWDTSEHNAFDECRNQIDGSVGRPYHDVQIAISGEAASILQDLSSERWRRATEEKLPKPASNSSKLWPDNLNADLTNVEVAVSRTEPEHKDYQGVQEVERLYLDSIAAAKKYIYIENQYFTSPVIKNVLAERLQEEDGPEIIIHLPLETEGWLAQNSMDIIRVKLLKKLREADKYQRLGIYFPYKKDTQTAPINLHAKIMIIDDRFVRVGSSNLNNRSMGLDTECDIAIELTNMDDPNLQGIIGFRNRLLAEHLGVSEKVIDSAIQKRDSVLSAIAHLSDEYAERSMLSLEDKLPEYSDSVLTEPDIVDPERSLNIDKIFNHTLPDENAPTILKRFGAWIASLILLMAMAFTWQYTSVGDWVNVSSVTDTLNRISESPFSFIVLIVSFIIAAVLMVPITLLIIGTVIVFGPYLGSGYALAGATGSAILGYAIGALLGGDTIQGLTGGKIKRISQKLAKQGVLTIIVARIVPVAPFTIVNLVAGASHVSLRDFALGTFFGMIPGITAIAILTDRVKATLEEPSTGTLVILIALGAIIIALGYTASRYLRKLSFEQ